MNMKGRKVGSRYLLKMDTLLYTILRVNSNYNPVMKDYQ